MKIESIESPTKERNEINRLKEELVAQILQDFNSQIVAPEDQNQAVIDLMLQKFRNLKTTLPKEIKDPLFHEVINEVLGFGTLQPLLDDPEITGIFVNGKDSIYVEKEGRLSQVQLQFKSNEELIQLILRNVKRLGLHLDPENPTLDGHLRDGSRINVVLPPIAIDVPILTIQKFSRCQFSMNALLESGVLSENIATFIRACVVSHLNILITGLSDSGKTALLNGITNFIPESERIVSIEEIPELNLHHQQVLRLESKLTVTEGKPSTTISDLIYLALRMRPDRLIIGEIHGSECLAFLHAMNTGSSGTMTTLRASSPADSISRMGTMCLLAGINLPARVINEQIASAIDLIINISRLKDGSRRLTTITEVSGMESENVILTDIFRFEQNGLDSNGRILGDLKPTGIRPLFTSRLEANGFKLSPGVFGVNITDIIRRQR